MLNIVLFGPPGAGKGTQSSKLIEKYNLVHLSTGDLLRSQIASATTLGLRAKQLMDNGILVPDEVVIGMIHSKIKENVNVKGFIFDGFPRTVKQAEALDDLLTQNSTGITGMIALEVSFEELSCRLLQRGKESGRPDDQDETLIIKRIQEYNEKTLPVANYYQKQNKFSAILGIGQIEDIFNQICSKIESFETKAI